MPVATHPAGPDRSAAFAALAVDIHGQIRYCNALAEDLTGHRLGQALNRPLDSVLEIAAVQRRWGLARMVQQAIADDQVVVAAAHGLLLNRAGEQYLVEYSVAPLHSRDGRVSGAMIVFRDVSVRQRTDTLLN